MVCHFSAFYLLFIKPKTGIFLQWNIPKKCYIITNSFQFGNEVLVLNTRSNHISFIRSRRLNCRLDILYHFVSPSYRRCILLFSTRGSLLVMDGRAIGCNSSRNNIFTKEFFKSNSPFSSLDNCNHIRLNISQN